MPRTYAFPGAAAGIQREMLRVVMLLACIAFALARPVAQEQPSAAGRSVHTEMRNVMYHYTDSISVHIMQLEGELVPTVKAGIPFFDDPNSFILNIHTAEISITADALANALNQYAFADREDKSGASSNEELNGSAGRDDRQAD